MTKFTAACAQMRSTPDVQENLQAAGALVREAKSKGASLVLLPENTTSIAVDNAVRLKNAFPEKEHPALPFFFALSKELNIWLIAGSISILASKDKVYNRSLLFGPEGQVKARYDKIHLYDAAPKPDEVYMESELILPGERAILADTPLGKIGLTICYDMRFPALYQKLASKGAEIITVPSAFTVPTGQAHWHVLLRARAIETGCFVLAAAQGGKHVAGRATYGHSLIISPWGEILAEAGEDPTVITAEIDLAKVGDARGKIANLKHARHFEGP
jgi:predicted amidohydrolase